METKKKTQERKFSSEILIDNIFFVLLFITIGTSGKNQQKKKSLNCFALKTTENTIKQEGYKVRVKIDTQKNFNRREKFGDRKIN